MSPEHLEDLSKAELIEIVLNLQARVVELEELIKRLTQPPKNASNSSTPPADTQSQSPGVEGKAEARPETGASGPQPPAARAAGHRRVPTLGLRAVRRTPAGGYESGTHDYGIEDDLAQGRLTEAAFDWLLDDGKPHPTRLERALAQFNALLGIYVSGLDHTPVDLPFNPPNGLLATLKKRLER